MTEWVQQGFRHCSICKRGRWLSIAAWRRLVGKKFICSDCEERKRQTGTYDLPPDILRERGMSLSRHRGTRLLPAVAERDNWICHLCGGKVEPKDATVDHLIPVVHGGEATMENLKLAHRICNKRRWLKPVCSDAV